jgi:hypothetical protein
MSVKPPTNTNTTKYKAGKIQAEFAKKVKPRPKETDKTTTDEINRIICIKGLKRLASIAVIVAVETINQDQFQEKPKWLQSSVQIWHLCMPRKI